jgi:ABC-type branched-subunit amino acid transport system ATPase component
MERRRGTKAQLTKITITIKNYRCFIAPATIEIGKSLTAFVGANNAGKSSILRFLREFRMLFQVVGPTGNFTNSLINVNLQTIQLLHVPDSEEVFSNLGSSEEILILFDFLYDAQVTPNHATKVLWRVDKSLRWKTEITTGLGPITFGPQGIGFSGGQIIEGGTVKCDVSDLFRVAETLGNTLYIGPFRNAINTGTNENYFDIQIGQAFIKRFRNLKTGAAKHQQRAILRLTDDIKNIFGFSDLAIDASADDLSLHLTVNGKPYKQHEMGSGLIQFVLVLANALIFSPKLILIDEPELNLHPSLQLDFLTTLASYASEGVWFATHSIGLARSSADRVYSVTKIDDGNSRVQLLSGTPRFSEFLGEMSFSSHKELGFEKLLLVEGPTEVKTVREIIRRMRKDHKILVMPLNGRMPKADDIEEILRITNDVSVLVDSERAAPEAPAKKDRNELFQLCKERGVNCKILDRRAMEHYFPDAVVKEVFGNEYRALGPFEERERVTPIWSKDKNWRLAAAWPVDDVKATDLGRFLDSL